MAAEPASAAAAAAAGLEEAAELPGGLRAITLLHPAVTARRTARERIRIGATTVFAPRRETVTRDCDA